MRAAAMRWLLAGAVLSVGCGGGGGSAGALMNPGDDCMACHSFRIAGTVFQPSGGGAEGVEVVVGGITLASNAAGNFYAAASVAFPATVETRKGGTVSAMGSPAPHGSCNRCHDGVTQGRLTAP